MKEVTDGRADAVAVANDYLSRVVERGDVEGAKFRSIYKSPSFPPACFGYAHKLHPDLAAKVKESFTSFSWEGTALAKAYAPARQWRIRPSHLQGGLAGGANSGCVGGEADRGERQVGPAFLLTPHPRSIVIDTSSNYSTTDRL